jgi:hypothetical protein
MKIRGPSVYEIIMIVLVIMMTVVLIFFCCCNIEDDVGLFNQEIEGRWEPSFISKSYGAGMMETYITFYNSRYYFGSNTISGKVEQQGNYRFDGRILELELSFSPSPFALVGKSGSEWIIQTEGDTLMTWVNNIDNTEVIRWLTGESLLHNRVKEELEDLPLPPNPIN